MKLSVEISKYPLHQDYIPFIKGFIDRVNSYEGLKVITNTLSTQIFGDYDLVMSVLTTAIQRSSAYFVKAIFVCNFLHCDFSPSED